MKIGDKIMKLTPYKVIALCSVITTVLLVVLIAVLLVAVV